MEATHSHGTNGGEDRTSPKGERFDRDTLLDLVRSIVRNPAVKDATVEMVVAGLREPTEEQLREGVRAGANEALARLSHGLRDGVKDALDALSEDDWDADRPRDAGGRARGERGRGGRLAQQIVSQGDGAPPTFRASVMHGSLRRPSRRPQAEAPTRN